MLEIAQAKQNQSAAAKTKKTVAVVEESKGGDMFDRAAAETVDKREKRLAEIRAKRDERDQAKLDRIKRKKEM